MMVPNSSAFTLEGGAFTWEQQAFSVHRVPHKEVGYWGYELQREGTPIAKAVCQPASLIQANMAIAGEAAITVDPIIFRLYGGQCHWIEIIQVFPDFRGRGYGSLWLESLCAVLQSEAILPIALQTDAWWDGSNPLQGQLLEDWYERHGFLKFPGTDGLFKLRVRDDMHRATTLIRVQHLLEEVVADLDATFSKLPSS